MPLRLKTYGFTCLLKMEHLRSDSGTDMLFFYDAGHFFQLLSIGTHEHEPVFFSLFPGFAVVRSAYGGKQPFLKERKTVSFGILLVGSSPQAQQTSSFFSTDSS